MQKRHLSDFVEKNVDNQSVAELGLRIEAAQISFPVCLAGRRSPLSFLGASAFVRPGARSLAAVKGVESNTRRAAVDRDGDIAFGGILKGESPDRQRPKSIHWSRNVGRRKYR
jgi:hypothetical protein